MCENCTCKHEAANISVILPHMLVGETPDEIIERLTKQHFDSDKMPLSVYILKEEDGDIYAYVVVDRKMDDLVGKYYEDIMAYHQAFGEDLSEEEMNVRDNEVKEKWLNGNYNYWILREEGEI